MFILIEIRAAILTVNEYLVIDMPKIIQINKRRN